MKRLLILMVLSAFMLGGMAYATETRVMTMGDVNNIVKDDANIGIYPQTINYYPNLFIGEFSGNDYWKAGANWQFKQESNPLVLGTYFSMDDFDAFPSWLGEDGPDHRIDLYAGMLMGEMPMGVNITYYNSGNKNEDDDVTNNLTMSATHFKFAFGASLMEKKLDASLFLAMTTWTDEDYNWWGPGNIDSGLVKESEPAGNMGIGFNARYWMDPMGKYTLVPHFGVTIWKWGADYYGDYNDAWQVWRQIEDRTMTIDLGLGWNYDAAEDVLVVGDFGFQLEKYKYQDEQLPSTLNEENESTMVLPYFKVGIDAKVFKWMDFRSGITSYWERWTYEPSDVEKRSYSYVETDTYLGAGFHWGKLTLDAQVSTDFIENGPYFISGDYTSDLFEQVTVQYAF